MSTDEHLQLIKSECERLLAIAEKRTPGAWGVRNYPLGGSYLVKKIEGGDDVLRVAECHNLDNAAYITSCARRAEAGWKATIAAIDWLLEIEGTHLPLAAEILAAWPTEILKP
jgi:hypothetical protein